MLVQPQREEGALWAMEQALRSGAAALVVAELVPGSNAWNPCLRTITTRQHDFAARAESVNVLSFKRMES